MKRFFCALVGFGLLFNPLTASLASAAAGMSASVAFGGSAVAGQSAPIAVSVTANGMSANGTIVDLEIYNQQGQQQFQKFFENQNFAAGETKSYSASWTPNAQGTYLAKAGVFGANWSSLVSWIDNAGTLVVSAPPAPGFSAAYSFSPGTGTVNQPLSFTVAMNDKGGAANGAIVDLEIYNQQGQQQFQKFFENQNFAAGETKSYSASWTPNAQGTYLAKAGVFGANWSSLIYWTDTAGTIAVAAPAPQPQPAPQPAAAPFTIMASEGGTFVAGTAAPVSVSVKNNGATVNNAIVDFEVYTQSNQQVFQKFFENQNLNSGSTAGYTINWTPNAQGTYLAKVGVFGANWSSLIYWTDTAGTIAVAAPAPQPQPAPQPAAAPVPVNPSDPLSGMKFWVDPNSPAKTQADLWRTSDPVDAHRMDIIAGQPVATWLGNWNANVTADVANAVSAASSQGATPVFITYNIPERDCGGFSAGGANNPDGYKAWIRAVASGLNGRRSVVIVEPDALAQMDCLSGADQQTRLGLISDAVQVLKAANAIVYLDAGNPSWIPANTMAQRLSAANIAQADGFALNVSNFYTTAENENYGAQVSAQVGGKHFVIDTSRNGNGSDGQWCNPPGRALGALSTTAAGNALVDALLWLKVPGESDGNCNGGPNAGVWWPSYAVMLAQNAGY